MPLTELNIRFPSHNQVIVKFDDDETNALNFHPPFDKNDFSDIAWYLENYAANYSERGGYQRIILKLQDWFVPALYQSL